MLGGAALEAAAEMPARYAVRWLLLWARLQRRLRQDPAPALAQAAALAPATGWPELRLMVDTERALALDTAPALRLLQSVAAEAAALQLRGAELGALLHATALAAGKDAVLAAGFARLALARAGEGTEALHADRALRWLAPARALAAVGEADAAGAVAAAGQEWLRTTAAAHTAPEFADSFLQQHPLNRALLTWRP